MIDDFRAFSLPHWLGLLLPLVLGALIMMLGLKMGGKYKRSMAQLLVALLILVRGSRYIMDASVGRFDIYDLFSLQICHIDLIVLIICLLKPNRYLFHFVFLIGIPMGLTVALFPGRIHPEPGLPRAILFIMSHMLLVVGALYIAVAERMRLSFKILLSLLGIGNLAIMAIYWINKLLGTNFLYIMYAPEGTVISQLNNIFGWPGYVVAMDVLAMGIMMGVYFLHIAITYLSRYAMSARNRSQFLTHKQKVSP